MVPSADEMLMTAWQDGVQTSLAGEILTRASVAQNAAWGGTPWADLVDRPGAKQSALGRFRDKIHDRVAASAYRGMDYGRLETMSQGGNKFAVHELERRRRFTSHRRPHPRFVPAGRPIKFLRAGTRPQGLSGLGYTQDAAAKEAALRAMGKIWEIARKADQSWASMIETVNKYGKNIPYWTGSDSAVEGAIKFVRNAPVMVGKSEITSAAKAALDANNTFWMQTQEWLEKYSEDFDKVVPEEITKIGAQYDTVAKRVQMLQRALSMSPAVSGVTTYYQSIWDDSLAVANFLRGVLKTAAAAASPGGIGIGVGLALLAAAMFLGRGR